MSRDLAVADAIFQQGYGIVDDFLPCRAFESIVSAVRQMAEEGQFRSAGTGRQEDHGVRPSVRGDAICWIDSDTAGGAFAPWLDAIWTLAKVLNRELQLGLCEFETHAAVYPPGTYYARHVDQFRGTRTRQISCVYYLNPVWDPAWGGSLHLEDCAGQPLASVLPVGNRLVCFRSDLPHAVERTLQPRHSLTGWLKTRP